MSATDPVQLPIDEQIIDNIVETISTVRPENGFLTTLKCVREIQPGHVTEDGLVVVIGTLYESIDNAAHMHAEWHMKVGLECYAIEPTESEIMIERRLRRIAADVKRALLQDLQRGGVAINTTFTDPDVIEVHGTPPSIGVTVRVHYRTLWNDPYRL